MEDTNSSFAWKYEQMLHKVPIRSPNCWGHLCSISDGRPIKVGEVWENPVTRERSVILERPWDNPASRVTGELTALVCARVNHSVALTGM